MTLLRKFAILLGLLGSTVVVGLGAALLFGVMLERAVSEPFRETTGVLTDLNGVKRAVGALAIGVESGDVGAAHDDLESLRATVGRASGSEQFESFVGPTWTHNLTRRARETADLILAWIADPTSERADAATASLRSMRGLVEAMEERVLLDAGRSADFGDEMRRLHLVTLFSGMLASALFGLLAIMLLRRWVLEPVATLGEATQRIAAGDFAHRVQLAGRDELALLGEQVNSMAGAIATMQHEAVERERLAAVGEMVRRLAHNLRNPLAGIRNMAELSAMRAEGNQPVREMQTEIMGAVDRFNEWLKELLNVTTPMRVTFADNAITPWLEGMVAAHGPMARMRGVTLTLDASRAPERARFDARQLEHAVVAVLTNAIQASPKGGTVRVEAANAAPTPAGARWWEITVRDEGPGISEELHQKIFRPYFTTKHDGSGIGLAITSQVVKRHGGRIDLNSRPGRGTRFLLRLPVDPPPGETPPTGGGMQPSG